MANINRVVLVGNLTRDPELRHTPSGTAVCSLRIAVNTRRKDGATGEWTEKPNYFDVTVWGNQGENCAQYLAKGRPGRDRRPARVARVGGAGRHQAPGGRGRRRLRAVPRRPRATATAAAAAAATSSCRPASRAGSDADFGGSPARRRHPVLTEEGRMWTRRTSNDGRSRKRLPPLTGGPAEVVLLLQVEGRRDRLQERRRASPLHLREGEDPLAADQRRVPPPPAPGRGRDQAGPRDGAAAVRGRGP